MRILKFASFYFAAICIFYSCASDSSSSSQGWGNSGVSNEDGNINISQDNIDNATKEIEKTLKDLSEGKGVQPVNFRELKKYFPENAGRFDLIKSFGETSGIMGFKYSNAKAKYHDGNKNTLDMDIIDAGSMSMTIARLVPWSKIEVDKETETGYERTFMYNGHKAYEKYKEKTKQGELAMIINDRFILKVKGRGVESDDLKAALDKVDIKGLMNIKSEE